MATATSGISVGTLNTSGGAPRLSGTSSDIDTDKLVDALVQAKQLPAVRLQSKITKNEAKVAAYNDMKGLLGKLQSAVAGLRNPPGALGAQENLFEKKDVYYSSSTTTSPASLLSVSAGNKVPPGKFDVAVERLATARKLSGDVLTSGSDPLAAVANGGAAFSGSFQLGLQGGTAARIDVSGTMSLQDVRDAINAQSSTTKVSAGVVKASDTDYRLVLTASDTGKEVTLTPAGGTDVLGTLGLSADGGASFKHSLAIPQTAQVKIDGVTVERSGNEITDAVSGITLDLFKAEPGTTVTVEVDRSLSGVEDQVKSFVDAYNNFRDFVAKQSNISSTGKVADDAVLFGDSLLRSVSQGVTSMLTTPVPGLASGAMTSLAGIGVTLDANNHLSLDQSKLESALAQDVDAVRNLLEFRFTSSSPDLGVYSRTNDLTDSSFRVSIVDADNDGVAESATADGVALTLDGNQLTGPSGTPYAGLSMLWTGHGSNDIDVTATQGVADRLYNFLDGAVDSLQGSLTKAADNLGQQDTSYQTEIDRINERADRYREQLIERFGAMETAMSLAKSMLTQVRAQMDASSSG